MKLNDNVFIYTIFKVLNFKFDHNWNYDYAIILKIVRKSRKINLMDAVIMTTVTCFR